MSRPSAAAAVATRASSSAVAPPDETPSTVAVVRAVGGTAGSRHRSPARHGERRGNLADSPSSVTMSRSGFPRPEVACAPAAHAVCSVAVTFTSCCGPITRAVEIPRAEAKAASCGPRASAVGSEARDKTVTDTRVRRRRPRRTAAAACPASTRPPTSGSYSSSSLAHDAGSDGRSTGMDARTGTAMEFAISSR